MRRSRLSRDINWDINGYVNRDINGDINRDGNRYANRDINGDISLRRTSDAAIKIKSGR